MLMDKKLVIISIATSFIGAACSVATAVDQIKNGDHRAAITGDAAGRAFADECDKRHINLFGVQVDENGKIK